MSRKSYCIALTTYLLIWGTCPWQTITAKVPKLFMIARAESVPHWGLRTRGLTRAQPAEPVSTHLRLHVILKAHPSLLTVELDGQADHHLRLSFAIERVRTHTQYAVRVDDGLCGVSFGRPYQEMTSYNTCPCHAKRDDRRTELAGFEVGELHV